MLIEGVAIDDPVVYCEHKYSLLSSKGRQLAIEGLPTAEHGSPGRPRLTIVSYSAMVHEALAVAEQLVKRRFLKLKLSIFARLSHSTQHCSCLRRAHRPLALRRESSRGAALRLRYRRVTAEGFHFTRRRHRSA